MIRMSDGRKTSPSLLQQRIGHEDNTSYCKMGYGMGGFIRIRRPLILRLSRECRGYFS
jgi:hypothetical protein